MFCSTGPYVVNNAEQSVVKLDSTTGHERFYSISIVETTVYKSGLSRNDSRNIRDTNAAILSI